MKDAPPGGGDMPPENGEPCNRVPLEGGEKPMRGGGTGVDA